MAGSRKSSARGAASRPRKKGRSGRRTAGAGRLRRRLLVLSLVTLAAVAGWLVWPFWQHAERFGEPWQQPSRLYGQPAELAAGAPIDVWELSRELDGLGYRKVSGRSPEVGEYRLLASGLKVHLRSHPTAGGWREGGLLEAWVEGSRVARVRWRGAETARALLEPPLLASYFGPDRAERRPVPLAELPEDLVLAVLAAEDAGFFKHAGLSLTGIARAAWVNLRGGGVRQGGSTITQQLVKNLFLSHERSLVRKVREAALALLIDLRYDKRSILQAYLNEIYWGASNGVSLLGVGAAAWAHFGKRPQELNLCESALLAGLIQSPGGYSPRLQPERARQRRDWVLGRMAELGWLDEERRASVAAEPLCYEPRPVAPRHAPYFADAAAREAERRFGLRELGDRGLFLLSTLRRADQEKAEEATAWGLAALEKGWEKGRKTAGPLQAVVVSLDPRSGAILAYVGGRDYGASQFDRAGSALRQAGSAFKPVIYAAAFEEGTAAPSAYVEDAPLTVALAGRRWTPRNSNNEFRGWVTVRTAVEESLNVPTVRVALDAGLPRIVDLARGLGITSRLDPYPSLALGAFEVTPVELATVYATLAAGGVRPPVHALESVLDRHGRPLPGQPLPPPVRVLSPQSAYLVTSVLQGVLDRGTGASARIQGLRDPLAGKTGTTNDRRDSWFGGYSPDRATLVWVGYDDNSETRLSGTRAALPIWARFTFAVRPKTGFPVFDQPPGIVTAVIDPETGDFATDDCPQVVTEVFREGHLPTEVCPLHGDWRDWPPRSYEAGEAAERRGPLRWLRDLFGRERRASRRP